MDKRRKMLEQLAYKHTHRDYKGKLIDGTRTVLHFVKGIGTCVVEVSGLTDDELLAKIPMKVKIERGLVKPSDEQIAALRAYAAENGESWKHKLSVDWMFARARVNGEHSAALQQLRNSFGDEWLRSFELPEA